MSIGPHMELVTELLPLIRRDFPLVDPTLLNPYNVNPLLDGEWLEMNATAYALERKASGETTKISWPVFAERGRYDTQAIGKVPVLFAGMFEFDIDFYGAGADSLGAKLAVGVVAVGGQNKRGLVLAAGTGTHTIVGEVTRVMTGKIRVFHSGYQYLTLA